MSIRTCCKKCSPIFVLLAMAILAVPAFAQTCLQDTFGKNVQCTANDVSIATITAVHNLDGTALTECNQGTRYTFVMTASVVVTSSSSRSNIGFYFAEDNQAGTGTGKGGGGALTGACWRDIIPPVNYLANTLCTGSATPFPCCTGTGSGTCTEDIGSNNYTTLDPAPDNCGDGNSGSTQTINILAENILCEPDATDHLRLPDCISWQVPGQTIQCVTSAPAYPWVSAAIPGTGSKCNCGVLSVPVLVQQPKITATKTANVLSPTGTDGSEVDYTVVVTNASNEGLVTINQICDDKYGTIATSGALTCAKGTLGTASNQSCTPTIPTPLNNPGDFVTCTFSVQQAENTTVADTITANGTDKGGNPLSTTAQASATTGDAPAAAQLTKTGVGAQSACVVQRYKVVVHNSSGATTDENLNLSGLSDTPFGDLTADSGNSQTANSIVGTTCGQAVGLGTLVAGISGDSGAFSAGSPFQLPAAGTPDYTCHFDGVICGTVTTITPPGQSSCPGFTHGDAVTATLASDETGDAAPSQSGGTLTVYQCLNSF